MLAGERGPTPRPTYARLVEGADASDVTARRLSPPHHHPSRHRGDAVCAWDARQCGRPARTCHVPVVDREYGKSPMDAREKGRSSEVGRDPTCCWARAWSGGRRPGEGERRICASLQCPLTDAGAIISPRSSTCGVRAALFPIKLDLMCLVYPEYRPDPASVPPRTTAGLCHSSSYPYLHRFGLSPARRTSRTGPAMGTPRGGILYHPAGSAAWRVQEVYSMSHTKPPEVGRRARETARGEQMGSRRGGVGVCGFRWQTQARPIQRVVYARRTPIDMATGLALRLRSGAARTSFAQTIAPLALLSFRVDLLQVRLASACAHGAHPITTVASRNRPSLHHPLVWSRRRSACARDGDGCVHGVADLSPSCGRGGRGERTRMLSSCGEELQYQEQARASSAGGRWGASRRAHSTPSGDAALAHTETEPTFRARRLPSCSLPPVLVSAAVPPFLSTQWALPLEIDLPPRRRAATNLLSPGLRIRISEPSDRAPPSVVAVECQADQPGARGSRPSLSAPPCRSPTRALSSSSRKSHTETAGGQERGREGGGSEAEADVDVDASRARVYADEDEGAEPERKMTKRWDCASLLVRCVTEDDTLYLGTPASRNTLG
ncbi:hypothetical protein B0H14DRAFT_3134414 [Mycena olivaceomarginata]|nr:hypothetical protein B0H14DRAFT_3134414 [Mycena olivaceomarginata]